MRKIFTSLNFLFLFVIVSLQTQAQSTQKIIAQRWDVASISNSEIEGLLKDASEEDMALFNEMMKEAMKESFFDFYDNGTYLIKMGEEEPAEGSWQLSDDETKIIIINQKGEEKYMFINSLTKQEMILIIEESEEILRTTIILTPSK